jgi:radical SAM protein with 4Fe4S-binding SPASM domain
MAENKDTFLNHRKKQEKLHFSNVDTSNPLSSLLTVEINTTELCNRTCVFCPRHDKDVYPNRNLNMSLQTAEAIANNLSLDNYKGKISYSGFSENLLNKQFAGIIKILKDKLPDTTAECNTNGDKLTPEYAKQLFNSGLDLLYINLYDGIDQIEKFDNIMKGIDKSKYRYRAHYSQADYGLNLNNRGGSITWLGMDEESVDKLKGQPCHYPFYKMFVDWDGEVIFCANDWQKERKVGNLAKQRLKEVWLGEDLNVIRKRLVKGDRSESPCNKCTVNGQLFGKPSFEILKNSL